MHIALLLFYAHPNPVYEQIAAALRQRGHTVWVGSLHPGGDWEYHDGERTVGKIAVPAVLHGKLPAVPVLSPLLKRAASLGLMLHVRRVLRRTRPDITQVNPACTYWSWVLPLFMPSQMRFVLDLRQPGLREEGRLLAKMRDWLTNQGRRFCVRFIYDRACFCHTASAKRILGKQWPLWADIVPLGVDTRFLTHNPAVSTPDGTQPVRFIYIGTISRVRHLEQILFASQHVLAVTDQFRVTLVGSGDAHQFYQGLVRQLGLDAIVELKPPVPYGDVPRVLADHDVALAYVPDQTPDWRYQPTLKVVEYRALGMPIVAIDNEPHRGIVEDGLNGVLVRDSVEELGRGMLAFITDRDFLQRCRVSAQKMRTGLSWDEVVEMYEQKVYLRLLKEEPLASVNRAKSSAHV